jgi:hypothetical protein
VSSAVLTGGTVTMYEMPAGHRVQSLLADMTIAKGKTFLGYLIGPGREPIYFVPNGSICSESTMACSLETAAVGVDGW